MLLNSCIDRTEVNNCLLCENAPCSRACPHNVHPGELIRSLYFDNEAGAANRLRDVPCAHCTAPCEQACARIRKKSPVEIRKLVSQLEETGRCLDEVRMDQVDLSADICGVRLENPFLLSSSVVASSYEMCARAFDMGWAGASFKTVCAFEQHEVSPRFSTPAGHGAAFYGFKNVEQLSSHSVEEDLTVIGKLKRDYPSKILIVSIMGRDEDEWEHLAGASERAGADVVECNFSCPNLESHTLGVTIGQSPELVERFTRATRKGCSIPVLAKMTPNLSDMVPAALAAKRGGADGISAINTISSITGVNIDTLTPYPSVRGRSFIGGYSGAAVKPIALRFITDLARNEALKDMHISGMGGIETWRDALEFILLGAGSLQITTAVMQYGYRIIDDLLEGLRYYLAERCIPDIAAVKGAAADNVVDSDEVERDTVLLPRFDTGRCTGCGRCYLSCRDGGHQAIAFDEETRKPRLLAKKCVGCHLCRLVCPVKAIDVAKQRIRRSLTELPEV
jgi:dihydropyrimidine dehydrogenase (NAD+) subunit PreA